MLDANTLTMDIQKILRDRRIIDSDPEVMSGTPVFVGTRVPLQTFFDYLEGEAGLAEFLEDFPHLQTQVLLVLEVIAKAMLVQERTAGAHST
ncbi:MAG: DUF433 domain-containing protein [Nostoc sp.]